MLVQLSEDMDKKRKIEMKPVLNREYSSICSTSKTDGGLLFGENILEQLKASKSSSQLVRTVSSSRGTGSRTMNRFSPYQRPSLNYQGPPQREAYRQTNNRQRFRRPGYQQNQRFQGRGRQH